MALIRSLFTGPQDQGASSGDITQRTRKVYTAREATVKLGVDAKTLRAWRSCPLCQITPHPSQADARLALYTLDELKLIARHHGRTLRSDDTVAREAHSPSRRELLQRLEETERQLAALTGHPAPPAQLPPVTPAAQSLSGAPLFWLPGGLVSWRSFAALHNIPFSTVQKGIDTARLPVLKGRWRSGRQTVEGALDADGRARFYALWHAAPRFAPCPGCPHSDDHHPAQSTHDPPSLFDTDTVTH